VSLCQIGPRGAFQAVEGAALQCAFPGGLASSGPRNSDARDATRKLPSLESALQRLRPFRERLVGEGGDQFARSFRGKGPCFLRCLNTEREDFINQKGLANRMTRLGEISPFGLYFFESGEFFSRKNRPMIWAKFYPRKNRPKFPLIRLIYGSKKYGWPTFWTIFFTKPSGHPARKINRESLGERKSRRLKI
jgi:hypothetical protein